MRVALVYDRLNKTGGAERVLQAFRTIFPTAPWYTSVWDPTGAPFTEGWDVRSSFLSRLPWVRRHHEYFALLMPFIFESFDFSAYDLVISIGSAECKGIITKPDTLHLHYCLTPTRYLYSHASSYLRAPLSRALARPLRAWDQVAATRPDIMIAISTQVKKRIKRYYHRSTDVIFPPVDTKRFLHFERNRAREMSLEAKLSGRPPSYFLVVSRLVPYKNLAFLLSVFRALPSRHLVLAGTGSESARLKRQASANVHFLGSVPDPLLPSLYAGATAYLQANEEDFGISMVEAQASGVPVLAYGLGGAADIVVPDKTGVLLPDHDLRTWVTAIDKFDPSRFDREACRANARRFELTVWKQKIMERIRELL